MHLFITVGSTKFEELIKYVDNEEFHKFIEKIGITKMVLQIGNGFYIPQLIYKKEDKDKGILKKVKYFRYKDSIRKYLTNAHIVVSHAGAGTTMECLRLGQDKKIVIVINKKLMNNHQKEFAKYMEQCNYLEVCENLKNLKNKIKICLGKKYTPFPEPTVEKFTDDFFRLIEK